MSNQDVACWRTTWKTRARAAIVVRTASDLFGYIYIHTPVYMQLKHEHLRLNKKQLWRHIVRDAQQLGCAGALRLTLCSFFHTWFPLGRGNAWTHTLRRTCTKTSRSTWSQSARTSKRERTHILRRQSAWPPKSNDVMKHPIERCFWTFLSILVVYSIIYDQNIFRR